MMAMMMQDISLMTKTVGRPSIGRTSIVQAHDPADLTLCAEELELIRLR